MCAHAGVFYLTPSEADGLSLVAGKNRNISSGDTENARWKMEDQNSVCATWNSQDRKMQDQNRLLTTCPQTKVVLIKY